MPGLLRVRACLGPLAAAGLVLIMISATALTLASAKAVPILFPLAAGLLAAFVAYGRWQLAAQPAQRGMT